MGHYITQRDLSDKLGDTLLMQLTDKNLSGVVNATVVNGAIDAAEGRFEAYLRARYSLPVPATPLVKSLCIDLAVFNLYQDSSSVDDGVYRVRKDAFDAALKTCEAINKGKAALDIPAAEETALSPASPDEVLRGSSLSPDTFSKERLRGY
jgi:phage gp36-like protein